MDENMNGWGGGWIDKQTDRKVDRPTDIDWILPLFLLSCSELGR